MVTLDYKMSRKRSISALLNENSKKQKLLVIVTNVMDCLLIHEQNFHIDIGNRKKKS